MKRRLGVLAVLVALGSTAAWVAAAAESHLPPPAEDALRALAHERLHLRADEMELDFESGRLELRGQVRARLGPLHVEAREISVRTRGGGEVRWLRSHGGVVARYRQLTLKAPELVVDLESQQARFLGGVQVRREGSWMKARRAVLHLDTRKLDFQGVSAGLSLDSPLPKEK